VCRPLNCCPSQQCDVVRGGLRHVSIMPEKDPIAASNEASKAEDAVEQIDIASLLATPDLFAAIQSDEPPPAANPPQNRPQPS
jgi:hypothetical protein